MAVSMLVMGGDFTCYCVVYNVIMSGQALSVWLPACQHFKLFLVARKNKFVVR